MNNPSQILYKIKQNILHAEKKAARAPYSTKLVAVSKTHPSEKIIPFIEAGQTIFAENTLQEAQKKWVSLQSRFQNLELHLIGPLQSRKVKEAIKIFDVIETIDREKIAAKIAEEMIIQKKVIRLYIQINTGKEPQKSGVFPEETKHFVRLCQEKYGLTIEGLMCIPPQKESPHKHFTLLAALAKETQIKILSMGMSNDYQEAIACGSTSIRLGSALFKHQDT